MHIQKVHFCDSIVRKGIVRIFQFFSKYSSTELPPADLSKRFSMLILFSPMALHGVTLTFSGPCRVLFSRLGLGVLCTEHFSLEAGRLYLLVSTTLLTSLCHGPHCWALQIVIIVGLISIIILRFIKDLFVFAYQIKIYLRSFPTPVVEKVDCRCHLDASPNNPQESFTCLDHSRRSF